MHQVRVLLIAALVVVAAGIGAGVTLMGSRGAEAVGGALLEPPVSTCTANNTSASVALRWTRADGATDQWIEYTYFDNGFAAGTYSVLPVDPNATTYNLIPPRTDLPNFWRVVSTTPSGVVASATGQFMPCYRPILLIGSVECQTFTSASVNFRWAPLANMDGQQYFEYDNDGDFAGTDVLSLPVAPWQQEMYRAGFQVNTEYYFRVVRQEADGTKLVSQTGYFVPQCGPAVNPDLYGTDDRLISPSLGIDAPINIRDVGWDGALGVPSGAYDVVRYNFATYPSLNGQIGGPGTVLIGGHVDYYVVGLAVFAPLRRAQPGNVLEYWDGNVKYTYVVDWVTDIPYSETLTPYLQGGGSSLLLITCNGVFDRGQFGGYNLRRLVHATLQ